MPTNLIREIILRFVEGTSDKVYKILVEQNKDGTYSVTALWGRYGKSKQSQVKADGVDKYRAFAVADELMHSKLDKGYYKTQKCGDELEFN
jgi:predicted DNA-binding WGR domain protein